MHRLTRLVALVGLGCGLLGCEKSAPTATGGAAPPARQVVVGFSQIGAESGWRAAETGSILAEAKKRGVELKFADGQGKQANQVQAIEQFVAQGVDAIILAPVVGTGWDAPLAKAKRAGIPVVLVDRAVETDPSNYATLIQSDHVEAGRAVARWLIEKTGGKAVVVQLEGTVGSGPAIDRKKGFEEVIATAPGITILRSQSGDFKKMTGKQVMEGIIRAEKGAFTAVYAHNDDMALGAIQALQEAGLSPGEKVLVMSIDGGREAFEAMVAGTLNCVMECNPLLGPPAFDAIEAIRAGAAVPKSISQTDRLFDRSEAAAALPSRAY
ncbi:MAG: ABC transporter substrate-binding protein [Leptolyngbya sp. PLA1]|nr:ABC transporter substrate-binding protein [Leptolyngbya sp. PLA1]